VVVKHAGKQYDIELDTSGTGEVFKYQLYSLTGVEPERQKIIVKGGQLKDETELSTLNIKPNHKFLMMGIPASDAPKAPTQKTMFLEDMTEAERAKQKGVIPAGLQNLGNTCYMNSTLQTLRFVPELQEELLRYRSPAAPAPSSFMSELGLGGTNTDLTGALRDLYKQMGSTLTGFSPIAFLQTLRTAFPQFAQQTRDGRFEQQDAEECWSQIVTKLRQTLKIQSTGLEAEAAAATSFVDKYLAGKAISTLKCDEETPDEPVVESEETFLKLDCHISLTTNFMRDGILESLTEKIDKHSPSLDREARYTKTTRVTRLPKYLTCHFVRFFWKQGISKKTKIMRKVTFPFELDATEFCSDELKSKLIPVRDKIRNLRKDAFDRERANKRARRNPPGTEEPTRTANRPDTRSGALAQMEAEQEALTRALLTSEVPDWEKEISGLVDPEMAKDEGQNVTGLYELLGVVTHQGASADSGHYCSYVKKKGGDGKTWYFFNDDKVTEVPEEKVEGLAGGGESHSALICLYQAVPITPPVKEEA